LEAAVTGKADVALSRLFSSAQELNAISDEISAQIRDLEAALASNGIGVSAWINVATWDHKSDEGHTLHFSAGIGYGKHNRKWGLLYSVWCDEFGEESVSFLRDTPRDVRIGALQKLPELFDKLAEETQKLVARGRENLSDAKEIAAALKNNGRK
jgi:hypothetical protein